MCSCSASGHVDLIVMSLEQALPIEVERLFGRVRRNALRERDLQAAPGLTVFLPRLEVLRLNTRQGEEEPAKRDRTLLQAFGAPAFSTPS